MLAEFEPYIDEWTLIPGDGGRFELVIDGRLLYSKLQTKRHAELDEFKAIFQQAIKDAGLETSVEQSK